MTRIDQPAIGVVIPAHRATATIVETLDAVAAQTVAPAAVVVVLDGPEPETEAIVRAHRLAPTCLVLPRNTGGPGGPRNVGAAWLLDQGKLEAIWFLDADDVPDPRFLEVVRRLLVDHPEADLVTTGFRKWSGEEPPPVRDHEIERPGAEIDLDWYLARTGSVLPSFSVLRTRAFDAVRENQQPFDDTIRINQDYELFIRLLHLGTAVRTVWSGGAYRMHLQGISADGPALWLCRMVTNESLARWFESRGDSDQARRFERTASSAMRTAVRHLWRRAEPGDRSQALRLLLDDIAAHPSSKSIALLLLLPLGLDRRGRRVRRGDARLSPV